MSKKSLFFLSLLFFVSLVSVAQTFSYQGGTFTVCDSEAKKCRLTSATGLIRSGHAAIPSEVKGYSVTEIGDMAFFRNRELKSIEFPDKLEKIGSTAFIGCTSLQEVDIESVYLNTIGIAAFAECSSLMDININPENPNFISDDGLVYTKQGVTIVCAASGRSEFNIKRYVREIGNCAFYGCTKLVNLTLPATVTYINNSAFNNCLALESINIPSSVTEIGSSAFSRCRSLTSIDIPTGVNKIGAGAFGGCVSLKEINIAEDNYSFMNVNGLVLNRKGTEIMICPPGLKEIEIPESVTSIAGSAFNGCELLEILHLPPTITFIGSYAFNGCSRLKTLILPEGLDRIDSHSFSGCSSLTGIVIPNSVSLVGIEAFSKCSSLQYLYIPSGVTKIEAFAFDKCADLEYIMFGESVESIGTRAFRGCDKIKTIVCYGENVPRMSSDTFDEDILSNVEVRVNPSSIDKYREASYWSNFSIGDIQEGDKRVAVVMLSQTESDLLSGENFKLTATFFPEDAENKDLLWTSADENVATVDEEGNVEAAGVGETLITSRCGEVSATCRVIVNPILAESLTISPEAWESREGTDFQIEATVLPETTTDKTLKYESDDETVASVDNEGMVSVHNDGSCAITVSTVDGSGLTSKCFVTKLTEIGKIISDPAALTDVYDQSGVLLKGGATREDLQQLEPGIYIFRMGERTGKVVIY